MGSASKTTNLDLNQWASTDRPVRMDFVEDNRKIDEAVGDHINNGAIHMTEALKGKLENPYEVKLYGGTGASEGKVYFDFDVKYVIVFTIGKSPISYNNSIVYINSGMAGTRGASKGVAIDGKVVKLEQDSSAVSGELCNLNKSGNMYIVVGFK